MNRNTQIKKNKNLSEICSIASKLKTAEDIESFLSELLTPSELEDVTKRWEIFKMLHGKKPQRSIAKELSVSLCKVTRGAKIYKTGSSIIMQTLIDESWRR